ncbi:band 7 protein AGAP004871-like isoform X2 [Anopheles stephensi]|uniref:band 7 protein AGAP004871-like isoform X2 n=1 Tax=Anopheles stephensi TaxID=30069 RepID=UPI0016588AE9|nr:band 7 protein AGAP004871-like isoform X2 [Anopheles stephensi]
MYHAQHLQTQQLQPPNQQLTSQQQQDQVRWKVKTHEPFAAPMHSPQSTSEASRKQPYPRPQYYAEADSIGCVEVLATVCSIVLMVLTLPISLFLCFKVVQEYERAVIFRLGRLRSGGARGPGVFFVLPCIDNYCKVDLRTVSFDVPPQEVLTRDSVTVSVDAVVYYRIRDPLNAVVQVANYSHSTRLLAATTLRNVLGTRNLSELLTEREAISHSMQVTLDEATDPWGVQVERVEIKDVSLPDSLQRSMAAEAEAAREARAKVIAAEGEMKSSRALKEASDIMCESPAALQLRYLQTLSSIAGEKNSTIVFPLPIELIGPLMNFTSSLGVQRTTAPLVQQQAQGVRSTTTSTSSPSADPGPQPPSE